MKMNINKFFNFQKCWKEASEQAAKIKVFNDEHEADIYNLVKQVVNKNKLIINQCEINIDGADELCVKFCIMDLFDASKNKIIPKLDLYYDPELDYFYEYAISND